MEYIAAYGKNVGVSAPGAEIATKMNEGEYYRTPHGCCNGFSLGSYTKGVEPPLPKGWLGLLVGELFPHLESTMGGRSGINWQDSRKYCQGITLTIGGGYTAFIGSDGVVHAETYVSCRGNAVAILYKKNGVVLFVKSTRHGIPCLAEKFISVDPKRVIRYVSQRKDQPWWVSGLDPGVDEDDQGSF